MITLRSAIVLTLTLGMVAGASAQRPATVDSLLVDFTGDGVPEIWKVDTLGTQQDSLLVTMSIVRSGKSLYTESTIVRRSARGENLARVLRLDRRRLYVLDAVPEKDWSVDAAWYDQARQALVQAEGLDSAAAVAVVNELKRGSRMALQTSVGSDASLFRAWSNRLGRFVVIGRCC